LAGHKPRTLHSLVPAGSCYFFELDSAQDAQHVAKALHGAQWGRETAWGRGQIAVGLWS
jgi:CRISPR-associated protein Cmr3